MWKYLANRNKKLRLAWVKTRATSAEILKVLLKVGRTVKIFYGQGTLFIGEEGGTFKNGPRFDRCEIYGGRVSTPTFRGWRFLPEFVGFRWNGSSESTHFPEGLVLGNSVKPCHLEKLDCRNSGSKFTKRLYEEGLHLWKRGEVKSPDEFQVFCEFLNWHGINSRTRPLYSNFRSVSGYAILAGIWSQEIAEVWNQEVAGIRGSRTGEPTCSDLRNSGVTDGGFGNQ
jgi:hypothetical protein